MNILLEIIAYFLFSIQFLLRLIWFVLAKIILFILIFFENLNKEEIEDLDKIELKNFLKTKEEKQRDADNIRGRREEEIRPIKITLLHRLYKSFYSNHFLTPKDIKKINNLFKEYENKEELSKRMYYNILYASKFWGFIYCYFGFSRRKYYYIDENGGLSSNLLIKFVAHHYILSSKMLLDYLIKENNAEDIYKFFVAIIRYSRYSFTDSQYEEGVLFKETMKSIFSNYVNFDESFEKDKVLTLTDKIIRLYGEHGHFYFEIIYFYLDLLFDSLFKRSSTFLLEEKRKYFIEKLNICFQCDIQEKSRIYLIKNLYKILPQYIENENKRQDYFYLSNEEELYNMIENNILLLKEIGEDMNEILSLIPDHKNLKKINCLKLENKLKVKEIKEKVKKI